MIDNQRAVIKGCLALLVAATLGGCAEQRLRTKAGELLAGGAYEEALSTLDTGIVEYPNSTSLRLSKQSARDTAIQQLYQRAQSQAAVGKSADARQTLKRLLQIEPRNDRARVLFDALDRAEKSNTALEQAKEKATKGSSEAALKIVEAALRTDPMNRKLLDARAAIERQSQQPEAMPVAGGASRQAINLDFREASVRLVFEAMARSTGISFIVDKDVRPDLKTTVYLRQSRLDDALEMILGTTQLNKKVLNGSTILIYPNTPEKQREYQDLVVRAFYLTNADAKQTGAMLKTMLKVRDPYIDERTNMVMIRESADTVRLAERMVELQDRNDSEVVLEVEVLEVSSTRLTELGVQYPTSFSLTPLAALGARSLTLSDLKNLNSDRIGVSTPTVTLNFKRELGDTDVLANPKIRAKNKEKAKILIGDKLPVITTTSTSTGFVSESVQYIDVGLKLEVEPSISPEDEVSMKIALEVSSLVNKITTQTGTVAYQIGTRSANTVLKLHDGETQFLAGLIKQQQSSTSSRIPGLGDIPVLGRLFSSQSDNGVRNEIVLSITPRIVRPAHRPEGSDLEFWSGTDSNARARRTLPEGKAPLEAKEAISGEAVAGNSDNRDQQQAPSAGGTTALSLKGPADAKVGDAFWVSLNLKTDTTLRSLPVQFAYDRDRFAFDGAEIGAAFADGKASLTKTDLSAVGRVMVTVAHDSGAASSVSTEWARLRFRAKSVGAGTISIATASPVGVTSAPTPPQISAPVVVSVK